MLDKFGAELVADPMSLERALAHQAGMAQNTFGPKGSLTSLWITVNSTLVSCYYNIDGPRTAQYDGGARADFMSARVVKRFGCPVLLVASRHRTITAFSLPDLSEISRMSFEAAVQSVNYRFCCNRSLGHANACLLT